MHFAYFIADPCETHFHFFFKCQGFLQRLFIRHIYFRGRDFIKPSPEELVAINLTEQLLKRELKVNGLRERIGPPCLKGIYLPPKLISLILHSQAMSRKSKTVDSNHR